MIPLRADAANAPTAATIGEVYSPPDTFRICRSGWLVGWWSVYSPGKGWGEPQRNAVAVCSLDSMARADQWLRYHGDGERPAEVRKGR